MAGEEDGEEDNLLDDKKELTDKVRERGLTVVPEAPRRTLELSYDYGDAGGEVQDDIPYYIEVNYTDTKLSHRFVRFELPDNIEVDDMRRTV